jgi:2-phosphosulfolactate phosphatase
MTKSVVIDCLPESVSRYRQGWAVVAIDVIRATTTAVTSAAAGRRCFPAPDAEAALAVARNLAGALLAGESAGAMPAGFEMDNSPAQLAARTDNHRPLVLVSSSGTRVIHAASDCDAAYLACFRCHSATADYLAGRHERIAVIGAGTKGEFREEDQICCAWVAAALMDRGYQAGSAQTLDMVGRWQEAPPNACLCSRSVDFLRRSGQLRDLDFILSHIDDLQAAFAMHRGEVIMIPHASDCLSAVSEPAA